MKINLPTNSYAEMANDAFQQIQQEFKDNPDLKKAEVAYYGQDLESKDVIIYEVSFLEEGKTDFLRFGKNDWKLRILACTEDEHQQIDYRHANEVTIDSPSAITPDLFLTQTKQFSKDTVFLGYPNEFRPQSDFAELRIQFGLDHQEKAIFARYAVLTGRGDFSDTRMGYVMAAVADKIKLNVFVPEAQFQGEDADERFKFYEEVLKTVKESTPLKFSDKVPSTQDTFVPLSENIYRSDVSSISLMTLKPVKKVSDFSDICKQIYEEVKPQLEYKFERAVELFKEYKKTLEQQGKLSAPQLLAQHVKRQNI